MSSFDGELLGTGVPCAIVGVAKGVPVGASVAPGVFGAVGFGV
jgi:hypothetical protein